jgi:hypothetical protein
MALVQLPRHCLPAASLQNLAPAEAHSGRDFAAAPSSATSADAKHVQDALYKLAIECPVKCIDGNLFVRISGGNGIVGEGVNGRQLGMGESGAPPSVQLEAVRQSVQRPTLPAFPTAVHIYNERNDFEKLAAAVSGMCQI